MAELYLGDTKISSGASGGGSYDDTELSNRVSALESIDHSKYLTEHQSLDSLAKKAYPIFTGGKYTFLNDYDESDGWVLVLGKYEKEGSSVHDPYSLIFNKKEYGNFSNGVYMFTRGRVYANSTSKFNSDIEQDRLAFVNEVYTKTQVDDIVGNIDTVLQNIING